MTPGEKPVLSNGQASGFRTVAGPAHGGVLQPGHKPLVVTVEGKDYFVGHSAEIGLSPEDRSVTLSPEWAFDTASRAILYYVFSRVIMEQKLEDKAEVTFHLITGIPQSYFLSGAKKLHALLKGTHVYRFRDREWTVHCPVVDILPQAMGAYYYAISSLLGDTERDDRVGVIDIGTFTTDFCLAENVEYRAWASDGVTVGISNAHAQLHMMLMQDLGADFSEESIRKAFMTRQVMLRGSSISIEDKIEKVIQTVGESICKSIPSSWDVDTMRLVIAGGGAQNHYFGEWLENKYPHASIMKENPYNAIVLGYMVFGDSVPQDDVDQDRTSES
jgi:hypothetical protein